ncbi:FIST signal transduction protein [Undibacterium umbellatum]|uniref:FIST C-terminal domain-containing protein n=1 Tax=Undibacterium umbellatum TaxID=2762300 RepID=A0ABR6ZB38_9BURK|nr:FIST N-terminal domain-containing protein [Undibacterium umbellatum]MBC3908417.1 FIST C-terminal domain-containing protein [Undibacterium umbellatum]
MQVSQCVFPDGQIPHFPPHLRTGTGQLILFFGSTALLSDSAYFLPLRKAFPDAIIAGCSTAGEIHGTTVSDDTVVVTIIDFEHTHLHFSKVEIHEAAHSFAAGQSLIEALPVTDLQHVLIFSDGLKVNGTELVRGLKADLPSHVEVTGGLSADGANFQKTLVCANDIPAEGQIVAVGLYGQRLKIGYGSVGGWDTFGPDRKITRSKGNVLYDLDGKPALELYKNYLGEHAAGLPSTALLFPLSLRNAWQQGNESNGNGGVVRTILAVDEAEQSMTFAGDMPEGAYARLMKANFERLIDGASGAASISRSTMEDRPAELALLISCVGRKLVLKQRIEEEVEAVGEMLGAETLLTGFYSYGEISPHMSGGPCELHNQTMTITTLLEI